MDEPVTTQQVMKEVGATQRQLNYWCRQGWLPGMPVDIGSGNDRIWNPEAVAEAKRLMAASKVFTPRKIDLPVLADFLERAAEAGVKP